MSDYLKRGFKEQLTTAMDLVVRTAVYEVMKIFENTLHDYEKELAHKGEEVTQLKMKLQTAELRLKDQEPEGDSGIKMNKTQMTQTQREPEVVKEDPGEPSGVPESAENDVEVPDDWCAPLGCETVTKQDNIICPSIRLRELSIPLWHIPVLKREVVNCDIEVPPKPKDSRRSRISAVNDRHKHTQDRKSPMGDEGIRRRPRRNGMKMLLQDIEQDCSDLTVYKGLRKRVRNVTGKEQENTAKTKKKQRSAATKSTEKETVENNDKNSYSCKFCKKVFNTAIGRTVHERSHKRCRGCKKIFPFHSALKCHKQSCIKLKKLLAKEATNPPKISSDVEKTLSPSKRQMTPSSSNHSELSSQGNESAQKYSCVHCNKKFIFRYKFVQHLRIHTGEKPFPCSMCPQKFRVKQSLRTHMRRSHKDEMNCTDTNGDLAWTEPVEDSDDNKEDLDSPSEDTSQQINHEKVQQGLCMDRSTKWQTMGARSRKGFVCLLCHTFVKTKSKLIEHFCMHTGEKLIRCERCPATFRTKAQLYIHRKRCRYPVIPIQCEKCGMKLPTHSKYHKHVSVCQKK